MLINFIFYIILNYSLIYNFFSNRLLYFSHLNNELLPFFVFLVISEYQGYFPLNFLNNWNIKFSMLKGRSLVSDREIRNEKYRNQNKK